MTLVSVTLASVKITDLKLSSDPSTARQSVALFLFSNSMYFRVLWKITNESNLRGIHYSSIIKRNITIFIRVLLFLFIIYTHNRVKNGFERGSYKRRSNNYKTWEILFFHELRKTKWGKFDCIKQNYKRHCWHRPLQNLHKRDKRIAHILKQIRVQNEKKKSGEAHYINCVCVCNLGR